MELRTLLMIAAAWLVAVNVATFWTVAWDKRQAVKRRRRFPEYGFYSLAALGGAPAGFLAMAIFRHKTGKDRFRRRFLDAFMGQAFVLACIGVILAIARLP